MVLNKLSIIIPIIQKKKLRSRQKKLKAYDLSTLTEFLPELDSQKQQSTPAAEFKLNCKTRQKLMYAFQVHEFLSFDDSFAFLQINCLYLTKWLVLIRLKEGKQLNTVLNHPVFQSDPLEAIHQHLQSTQPVMDEKPKKKVTKNGGKKVKGKKAKVSNQCQSMDF